MIKAKVIKPILAYDSESQAMIERYEKLEVGRMREDLKTAGSRKHEKH